jgi:hypothetical protein
MMNNPWVQALAIMVIGATIVDVVKHICHTKTERKED